jgi:RNA-directed DNA polymerase
MASYETERPVSSTQAVMEVICSPENIAIAMWRVRTNKGAAGVDGMTVHQLAEHLKAHWPQIQDQLLSGTYRPMPVRRVEIPKPDGGVRKLGIPTVVDRLIQQAVLQVLTPLWEPTFSEHSYGFRPGRSAHQAVSQAQAYIAEGRIWLVDLDLEKFFDRVHHDRLMARLAYRISDKRLLKLIRGYLNAGVMQNGLVSATREGTPQGGPLSPLLSNIVLDELDQELERRGHRFVRYADDCNIYVRSERAGQRVMEGTTTFIARTLKLKVNQDKSAVDRPHKRKFLGFSFTVGQVLKRRISPQSLLRFRKKVKRLTRRTRSVGALRMVEQLTMYLRGWIGYYGFCQTPSVLRRLDSWIARRLRCVAWKQWRHPLRRFRELVRRGVPPAWAKSAAMRTPNPWRASLDRVMNLALPKRLWYGLGLLCLETACWGNT